MNKYKKKIKKYKGYIAELLIQTNNENRKVTLNTEISLSKTYKHDESDMSTIGGQGRSSIMSELESDAKVDQIQNDIIKIKLDKAIREKIKIKN